MESVEMPTTVDNGPDQAWGVMHQHPYAYMAPGHHIAYVPDGSAYAQPHLWGPQYVPILPGPQGQFYGGVMPGYPSVTGVAPETCNDAEESVARQSQQEAGVNLEHANCSKTSGPQSENLFGADSTADAANHGGPSAEVQPGQSQHSEAAATAASGDNHMQHDQHDPAAAELPWGAGSHVMPIAIDGPANGILDEREVKRQRRKQSNRESARRSRMRKQQETEKLAKTVQLHQAEIAKWRTHVQNLNTHLCQLAEQVRALGGTVDSKLLDAPMPSMCAVPTDELSDSDPATNEEQTTPAVSNPAASQLHVAPVPATSFSQVAPPLASHPQQASMPLMHPMTVPYSTSGAMASPGMSMPGVPVAGVPISMIMPTHSHAKSNPGAMPQTQQQADTQAHIATASRYSEVQDAGSCGVSLGEAVGPTAQRNEHCPALPHEMTATQLCEAASAVHIPNSALSAGTDDRATSRAGFGMVDDRPDDILKEKANPISSAAFQAPPQAIGV